MLRQDFFIPVDPRLILSTDNTFNRGFAPTVLQYLVRNGTEASAQVRHGTLIFHEIRSTNEGIELDTGFGRA